MDSIGYFSSTSWVVIGSTPVTSRYNMTVIMDKKSENKWQLAVQNKINIFELLTALASRIYRYQILLGYRYIDTRYFWDTGI